MRVHVSTFPQQKNQRSINTFFSTVRVDSGQTAQWWSRIRICDVEKRTDLHHWQAIPILPRSPVPLQRLSVVHRRSPIAMARSNAGKAKAFFRANPSGAFDQYLQDIQKLPLIKDPAEERRLARRVQRGDEKAAERLVTANLRFVISYVKKYQGHGLDLSELVAIGNEGLLKAVKKFDPDQGVKFISYAVWWVRQAVLKALAEQTRSVRIPLNQNSQLIRMSRTETYLSQELGREPTDDEIAMALEDTVDNVRTARRMTAAELSLDAPVDRSDKDAATLGERFAGQEGGEIEEKTDGKLMREFIDRIFQKYLTPRERKILYLYYGLEEGSEAMTLEKIGALMGVTRERIRQIRERAFEKLRESPDGRALKGFWRAA
ncbi:MAG TPA: RNA polymerase sigma factor RpoD/SigA [Gemmatimonadales bacterium]|nr:RNA polymerase sigma factor RpoD/SigA [Gemmatimonadales bacterium]